MDETPQRTHRQLRWVPAAHDAVDQIPAVLPLSSVRVHGHGSFLRRLPRERLRLLDPRLDPLLLLDRPDLHLLPRPELPHVAHVPALELEGGAGLGGELPDRARSAYTGGADAVQRCREARQGTVERGERAADGEEVVPD